MRSRPLDVDDTERRIRGMLEDAGLPQPISSVHDRTADMLALTWPNGLTYCFDLLHDEFEAFGDEDRAAMLAPAGDPPVDVTVVGSPEDPRDEAPAPPGVRLHHVPHLHPDDVTTVDGIPCTTPARTLIDLAEVMDEADLREAFRRADELGLLEPEAVRAARGRVEWRPSLAMLDAVIEDFCP